MMSSFSAAAASGGGASAMAAGKGDAWDCELGTSALEVPGARCLGLRAWPPPPRLPSTPNGAAVWEPTRHTRHTDTQTHRHTQTHTDTHTHTHGPPLRGVEMTALTRQDSGQKWSPLLWFLLGSRGWCSRLSLVHMSSPLRGVHEGGDKTRIQAKCGDPSNRFC